VPGKKKSGGALMNVEYTGRRFEITPAIRKEVETGLTKIRKILRDKFDGKVVLTVEKHRHKAEITITPRNGPLVGLAQSGDMNSAINEALGHLEKQAVKYKARRVVKKRHPRANGQDSKWNGHATAIPEATMAVGITEASALPVLVHKFPVQASAAEVHLVNAKDSVALRPMTLEEAVKEAHFRDRDVFVFRDPKGKVMVLHRTRDGKLELIEAP
jgi:ribosome hibernation promoting factor